MKKLGFFGVFMRTWGYGATAARLTPDRKVGSSNLSGLIWDSLALCNYHGLGSDLSDLGKQQINGFVSKFAHYLTEYVFN